MNLAVPVDAALIPYKSEIRPEQQPDGQIIYMAEIPDLPGCMSHGATVEEARQNLEDAQQEYIEALKERGLSAPAPSASEVGSITWMVGPTSYGLQRGTRTPQQSYIVTPPDAETLTAA